MSLTRLICPHCEKPVTLQLTEVVQKRECPECGNTIILQFITYAGRATPFRRKTLLIPRETVEAPSMDNDAIMLPRSLEGNIKERMLHDPEVKTSASTLRLGLIIVSTLLVLAVAGHYLKWWTEVGNGISVLANKLTAPSAGLDPGAKRDVLPANYTNETPSPTAERTVAMREPELDPLLPEQPGAQRNSQPVQPPPVQEISTGNPDADSALKTLRGFLDAKTPTERLRLVRDQLMLEPKFRRYYTEYPAGPIAYTQIKQVGDGGSGMTFVFDVVLANGEERRAIVGKTVAGTYLVDWASFVIYSDKKWSDFMEDKTTEPVLFRVLAIREDHFEGEFTDSNKFGCVKLVDPVDHSSPPIYAYYSLSTILGREMEFVLKQSMGQAIPLILTLKYPDVNSTSENQVLVVERIAEGWVAGGR